MELLEFLICSWDVQAHAFRLGEYMLEIKVEDIYFLTCLSMRGVTISLLGGRRVGEIMKDYISTYCRPQVQLTRDCNIIIRYVTR